MTDTEQDRLRQEAERLAKYARERFLYCADLGQSNTAYVAEDIAKALKQEREQTLNALEAKLHKGPMTGACVRKFIKEVREAP